jgi:hypothetical protein
LNGSGGGVRSLLLPLYTDCTAASYVLFFIMPNHPIQPRNSKIFKAVLETHTRFGGKKSYAEIGKPWGLTRQKVFRIFVSETRRQKEAYKAFQRIAKGRIPLKTKA